MKINNLVILAIILSLSLSLSMITIVQASYIYPDVFVRGEDNAIWYRTWDGTNATWGDWRSIGGIATSDPAASKICGSPAEMGCYVHTFVRGSDNALWAEEWHIAPNEIPSWKKWYSYGGILSSSPGAVAINIGCCGETYIFVRGSDNALWFRSWRTYGNWEKLDGTLTSGPAAIAVYKGGPISRSIYVFARGTDNTLLYNVGTVISTSGYLLNFAWSNWKTLGGNITSDPDTIYLNGKIGVIVRGTDNALWYKTYDYNNDIWSNWEPLGGVTISSPGGGYNRVFVRGMDNALWYREWDTTWRDWKSLGGVLSSGPGAIN